MVQITKQRTACTKENIFSIYHMIQFNSIQCRSLVTQRKPGFHLTQPQPGAITKYIDENQKVDCVHPGSKKNYLLFSDVAVYFKYRAKQSSVIAYEKNQGKAYHKQFTDDVQNDYNSGVSENRS